MINIKPSRDRKTKKFQQVEDLVSNLFSWWEYLDSKEVEPRFKEALIGKCFMFDHYDMQEVLDHWEIYQELPKERNDIGDYATVE